MEGLDFSPGIAIVYLMLTVVLMLIAIAIKLISVYFLTLILTPYTAKLFKFENRLTGMSRFDFFSFQFTWVVVAPLVLGLLNFAYALLIRNTDVLTFTLKTELQGFSFGLFSIYLLSLTLWYYDSNLEKFKIKPMRKNIVNAAIFVGVYFGFILIVLLIGGAFRSISRNFLSPIFEGTSYHLMQPALYLMITYLLMKKNMIPAAKSEES